MHQTKTKEKNLGTAFGHRIHPARRASPLYRTIQKTRILKITIIKKSMETVNQVFQLEVIGEQIKSAYRQEHTTEQIVFAIKTRQNVWNDIYVLRSHYGEYINSIWISDTLVCITVAAKGAISWCELIDRRTGK